MAADGTVTEFPAPGIGEGGTFARQLAAGTDSLWFAQPQTNSLGLIICGTGMTD